MHILVSPSPPSTQTRINTPVRQFTPAICTLFLFGLVVFLGVSTRMLFTINGTQLLSRLPVRVLTRTHFFNPKTIIRFIQARRKDLENNKQNNKVIVSAELPSPFLHPGQRWVAVKRLKILTPYKGIIHKG
jgi:hypothetical protein